MELIPHIFVRNQRASAQKKGLSVDGVFKQPRKEKTDTEVCNTIEPGHEQQQSCPNWSFDFAFGFDDPEFSDRVLKILIFDGTLEEKSNGGRTENCKFKDLLRPLTKVMKKEEDALMDVLRFIYTKTLLSENSPDALLRVVLTADKYDVPSCVNYCCALLSHIPMNAELALSYIDLSSIISVQAIQPLLNAAKDFLPIILKDVSKHHKDIISLSLDGIKLVLSHNDLKVDSEDEAYDLLIEWSKENFPDSGERYNFLKNEMFGLISFQHMSSQKLKTFVHELCDSIHHQDLGVMSSMISSLMEAILDDSRPSLPKCRRAYNVPPVKVVTSQIPNQQCVVYLDLKREECKDTEIYSQTFKLDENVFQLRVEPRKHEFKGCTFGLFLCLKKSSKESPSVNFEFLAKQRSSLEAFVRQHGRLSFTFEHDNQGHGFDDLFVSSWNNVMSEDSQYFINGVLHLRADITLVD